MREQGWLVQLFERNRTRLRAVAYRMLGSLSEAEDAVQEAWLRLSRTDGGEIENVDAWLTTVVARICLNMLRARKSRPENPVGLHVPDPIVSPADRMDPEQAVLLGDSVGLALLVVLETLAPDERLAFVLHDMFGVPFNEIASIVGCSPTAARQLASRARRRVRGSAPVPEANLARQREVVEAFVAAAHHGDFDALLAILDPDIVLRADRGVAGGGSIVIRGARAVAKGALMFSKQASKQARFVHAAIVNGAAGIVSFDAQRRPFSVLGFAIANGKIIEIDILADPVRLRQLDLAALSDSATESGQ
jgi:RNA polymerase sigma factor (sigma-70 family)